MKSGHVPEVAEGDQPVTGEVQDTKRRERVEPRRRGDLVVVEIEDVEPLEPGQAGADGSDSVAPEHEHPELRHALEPGDLLHRVGVQVEEHQISHRLQPGYPRDGVVLVVEQSKPVLVDELGALREFAPVEVEAIGVGVPRLLRARRDDRGGIRGVRCDDHAALVGRRRLDGGRYSSASAGPVELIPQGRQGRHRAGCASA